jgi:hypothetical protein
MHLLLPAAATDSRAFDAELAYFLVVVVLFTLVVLLRWRA